MVNIKMKNLLRTLLILPLIFAAFTPATAALGAMPGSGTHTQLPAGPLRAGGMLNAEIGFKSAASLGALAASGQWEKLGVTGGVLSNAVSAIAVDGSNVYIGG